MLEEISAIYYIILAFPLQQAKSYYKPEEYHLFFRQNQSYLYSGLILLPWKHYGVQESMSYVTPGGNKH